MYVESWVAFIVVCVQTSPYYVELVIHKNATYTHKHFTGNSVGVARFICILQPFMTFYENASLLFLISNINCDSVIFDFIWKILFSRLKFSKRTMKLFIFNYCWLHLCIYWFNLYLSLFYFKAKIIIYFLIIINFFLTFHFNSDDLFYFIKIKR